MVVETCWSNTMGYGRGKLNITNRKYRNFYAPLICKYQLVLLTHQWTHYLGILTTILGYIGQYLPTTWEQWIFKGIWDWNLSSFVVIYGIIQLQQNVKPIMNCPLSWKYGNVNELLGYQLCIHEYSLTLETSIKLRKETRSKNTSISWQLMFYYCSNDKWISTELIMFQCRPILVPWEIQ